MSGVGRPHYQYVQLFLFAATVILPLPHADPLPSLLEKIVLSFPNTPVLTCTLLPAAICSRCDPHSVPAATRSHSTSTSRALPL
ncbi:hypothetical protein K469DRAFT_706346 [Zopfia rhizophila CBS 207.26]|uniref:Secreted protein n=1 Tax=Zopfia rhizophila CBS 207.26 TaxID=1314779 RepID=A0A6A6EY93_9PEZI|nr:hypothetical protein K469DRAFT_706346 [Zopfia rhizophila CBS 207.26]